MRFESDKLERKKAVYIHMSEKCARVSILSGIVSNFPHRAFTVYDSFGWSLDL